MPAVSYENAALMVVDMQNDFVTGSVPVRGASDIIPTVNLWIEIFEDLEAPILYSLDWHQRGTPASSIWGPHCVAGSRGARVCEDVIYRPAETKRVYTILKDQDDDFSAYSGPSEVFSVCTASLRERRLSSVEAVLRLEGVDTVFVVGISTDYAVRATVLDLLATGRTVVVVLDAITGWDDADAALVEMERAGAVFMRDEKPVACFLPEFAMAVAV